MSGTLQPFLTLSTQNAADNLVAAFLRLPEDKRHWSPEGKARTAIDQIAECAILNGSTIALIETRQWRSEGFEQFIQAKAEAVEKGWEYLEPLLKENTARFIATIQAFPEADLNIEVALPWGSQTLGQILGYPFWNMSYHEGQINYIASMLGCLD